MKHLRLVLLLVGLASIVAGIFLGLYFARHGPGPKGSGATGANPPVVLLVSAPAQAHPSGAHPDNG